MTTHVYVDNIKCSGCSNTVEKKLNQIPTISNVLVDVSSGKVTFDCEDDTCRMEVISSLKKLGYPLSGKGSNVDKAKSYVSCMVGKIDNLTHAK